MFGATRKYVPIFVTAALVAAAIPVRVLADDTASTTTPPLTVVTTNGTTTSLPYVASYDFGSIYQGETKPIRHDFVLRNNTNQPVTIDQIKPTCGCTTAILDTVGSDESATVPPGATVTIHVAVDPTLLAPPQVEKAVWIYENGDISPSMTLLIKGNMTPSIELDPPVLDFGTVRPGTTPSLTLKVTLDRRVFPTSPPPQPSGTPVSITAARNSMTQLAETSDLITRSYVVTLSRNAHLGPLSGWLSIPQDGVKPEDRIKIPLSGSVVGDISPYPSIVAFGEINAGRPSIDHVDIVGVSKSALMGLRVESSTPGVRARIVPGPDGGRAKLEVTIAKKQKGTLSTSVQVVTKSGQILDVPVWADIE
jgi:hypothetical protein